MDFNRNMFSVRIIRMTSDVVSVYSDCHVSMHHLRRMLPRMSGRLAQYPRHEPPGRSYGSEGTPEPRIGDCPSPEDYLLKQHIIIVESGQNGALRPRLRFRNGPAGLSCPFLVNDLDEADRLWGKCSLHDTQAKPLVCRLAPLARTVDLTDGSEVWMEVPPVAGCPGWKAGEEPPPEGREIPAPALAPDLRADLDVETENFRNLSAKLSET